MNGLIHIALDSSAETINLATQKQLQAMERQQLAKTVAFLQDKTSIRPEAGIVMGSGLGKLGDEIDTERIIPYSEIPHFPVSTVAGHKGQLLFGTLRGKQVVALQGRFHYYEGYSLRRLTFPIRVMGLLGIDQLYLSNASGGINEQFSVSDIMLIHDHINLIADHPLIGPNHDDLGPRFPDMSEPYDTKLLQEAESIGQEQNIPLQKGVFSAMSGPYYETIAEYRYLDRIGVDAIGMSTIPEVIAAVHMGIRCFAISIITDMVFASKEDADITHEEVLEVANSSAPKATRLISEMVAREGERNQ